MIKRLPKEGEKLIFLGLEYKVCYVDNLKAKEGELLNGYVSHTNMTIMIDKGIPDAKKLHVLWHEIFHIFFHLNGHKEEDDELLVDSLASAMNAFIIYNK